MHMSEDIKYNIFCKKKKIQPTRNRGEIPQPGKCI